jgi:hypothetical protein
MIEAGRVRGALDSPSTIAGLLASGTAGLFAVDRFVLTSDAFSSSDLPGLILVGIVIGVAGCGFHAGRCRRGIGAALTVAFGPVAGFAIYLLAYHLRFPPSQDSPTSLVFLAFAVGMVTTGVMSYTVGWLSSRPT